LSVSCAHALSPLPLTG